MTESAVQAAVQAGLKAQVARMVLGEHSPECMLMISPLSYILERAAASIPSFVVGYSDDDMPPSSESPTVKVGV